MSFLKGSFNKFLNTVYYNAESLPFITDDQNRILTKNL